MIIKFQYCLDVEIGVVFLLVRCKGEVLGNYTSHIDDSAATRGGVGAWGIEPLPHVYLISFF